MTGVKEEHMKKNRIWWSYKAIRELQDLTKNPECSVDLGNHKSKINQLFWNFYESSYKMFEQIAQTIIRAQNECTVHSLEDESREDEFFSIYLRVLRKEQNRFRRWQDTASRWMKRCERPWAGAPEWNCCFHLNSLRWDDLL
jgi:hypothetical protein